MVEATGVEPVSENLSAQTLHHNPEIIFNPCFIALDCTAFAGEFHCSYGTDVITDVPADEPYAKAVAWAVANGITSGTSETTFSPDATCTRGQIVTFLNRAIK